MATLEASRDRYAQRLELSDALAEVGDRTWAGIDRSDITGSWRELNPHLMLAVSGAQLAAAQGSDSYVDAALSEQGIDADPEARVVPRRLAGIASDGRTLDTLLDQPRITTLTAIQGGVSPDLALATGWVDLERILRTQVADAGRVSDGIAVTARPRVGYVRMLSGKSCGRCAILAGKWFAHNQGFLRHPRCDCIHCPSVENVAGDLATDPKRYFNSLTDAEQNDRFGKANAQAIRDGADPARVVNAGRKGGIYTTADGRQATRERGRGIVRITPEEIYRIAPDRATSLDLLRLHGYIT